MRQNGQLQRVAVESNYLEWLTSHIANHDEDANDPCATCGCQSELICKSLGLAAIQLQNSIETFVGSAAAA